MADLRTTAILTEMALVIDEITPACFDVEVTTTPDGSGYITATFEKDHPHHRNQR